MRSENLVENATEYSISALTGFSLGSLNAYIAERPVEVLAVEVRCVLVMANKLIVNSEWLEVISLR